MTEAHLLLMVEEIALQAAFWASAVFPLVTSLFWPWWQSEWGRNIIALEAAIALTLLPDILIIEFGMVPGSTPGHVLLWTATVSLCLVTVIIVWRGALIFRAQRAGRARDRERAASGHDAPTPPEGIPVAD